MEKIKIILTKGAKSSTLETSGFTGSSCLVASAIFKEKLGQEVDAKNKDEMYESQSCEEQVFE